NFPQQQGFPLHTFTLLNKRPQSYFLKFHSKPKQPLQTLLSHQPQILHPKHIHFHPKHLYQSIHKPHYPQSQLP
ncbi:catalase, partial [Staphylococcus hominis]|uniref:catalase n=1 Tax=Staphylococcus hominis TaxID=1290 RepID=UPI00119CC107